MSMERIRVWITHFADREALQLQWCDPASGRKRTRSARTADLVQAEAARVDLEADLNAGRHHDVARLSWSAFRERFEFEHVATLRPNSRLGYRDSFRLVEEVMRPASLRGITAGVVSAFAAALRTHRTRGPGEGLCAQTIRVHLIHLRTALLWAKRQGLLSEVPAFPVVKVPKRRPRPVAPELYERLIARAGQDQPMRVYLMCGWWGGLRLSEAFALAWEETDRAPWVDFARRRIWFPADHSKNAEDQWVPLHPKLAAALDALPRTGPRVFSFRHAYTGRPITANALSGRVVKLAKKAGVRLSMHALRKGAISDVAMRQLPQVAQRFARHADMNTTFAYYAAIDKAVETAVFGMHSNNSGNTPVEILKNTGDSADL